MSHVVLQPAGNAFASEHYVDTIARPVSIERILRHVDGDTARKLTDIYPSGKVPVWGAKAGAKNVNVSKWERLQPGDIALFAKNKMIFASGVITHKIHNPELAYELWKTVGDSLDKWEYIYFLDEIRGHEIPYEKLNVVAGYAPHNIIQGFSVLDDEKSEAIISAFDLSSSQYLEPVSKSEFEDAVNTPNYGDDLDTKALTNARKEQGFLRRILFGDKPTNSCVICGKEYPITFLVAAHIKKRKECSTQERLDAKYIVASMCKFGCDELYEKGYIVVMEGKVQLGKPTDSQNVNGHLSSLLGNPCPAFNENTKKYFEWHSSKISL